MPEIPDKSKSPISVRKLDNPLRAHGVPAYATHAFWCSPPSVSIAGWCYVEQGKIIPVDWEKWELIER